MKQKIISGGHKMAKKVEKNTVLENLEGKENTTLQNLTSGELLARYKANVAERNRLSEENKELIRLYNAAKSQEKTVSTEAKIQALTAQLEALKNHKSK
jgi:cell shape-determining protein MreC